MDKELTRLIDTAALHAAEPGQKYTFDSVKRLGSYVLHAAWVLTIKPDGTYKARLVARGDRQPTSTYDETTSSAVTATSINFLHGLVAAHGLETRQMDAKQAYTNASIPEKYQLFRRFPPGPREGEIVRSTD
jgi:hypothetical protein